MIARKLADRWLRREVAWFVSWVSLAFAVILAILMFATNKDGETLFGRNLGLDYGIFYVVGQILNEGASHRLFDLDFQDERLHQVLPKFPKDEHLPFVYPPFLTFLFRPLAILPYPWSVAAWLAISVGLYATAVALTLRACASIQGPEQKTAWLLALSFSPFTMECGLGGQLSAIGCLAVSAGLLLQHQARPLLAGLAFSLMLYKPTLLLLLLPMLIVGRSWRILAGFALGGLILGAISWLAVGTSGCRDWLSLMVGYGRAGGSVAAGFKTFKFIDLTSFLRLLGISQSWCRPLAFGFSLPVVVGLWLAWARTARGLISDFTWASTIVLTPILNVYGPIYDVTMFVPGLLLGANAIRRNNPSGWPDSLIWLLALVYVSSMLTQSSALKLGFQPLTLALLAIGVVFLRLALRDQSANSGGELMEETSKN
jgi:hypothetical protein